MDLMGFYLLSIDFVCFYLTKLCAWIKFCCYVLGQEVRTKLALAKANELLAGKKLNFWILKKVLEVSGFGSLL